MSPMIMIGTIEGRTRPGPKGIPREERPASPTSEGEAELVGIGY